jgi:hypothetical protein
MARRPLDDLPTLNVALCHGTAGRAHLFHRLGTALADDELLATARAYYLETLARLPRVDPADGTLRSGTAGIALCLLGAVSAREPQWDRVLLLRY